MTHCILYNYILQYGKHFLSSENPGNKLKLKSVLIEYHCPLYKERWSADLLTLLLWTKTLLHPRKFRLSKAQKKYRTLTSKTGIFNKNITPLKFFQIISHIQHLYFFKRDNILVQENTVIPQKIRVKYTLQDLPFIFRNNKEKDFYSFVFERQINDLTLDFYLIFSKSHILHNFLFLQLFGFFTIENKNSKLF
jgi:hypothetical protein